MDRRRALQLAMAVLVLGLIGAGAKAADQKMVFKASDVQPAGYPTVAATENLGKKLAAATNGRLADRWRNADAMASAPISRDSRTHSSRLTPRMGTNGTTSTAPIRGCPPL